MKWSVLLGDSRGRLNNMHISARSREGRVYINPLHIYIYMSAFRQKKGPSRWDVHFRGRLVRDPHGRVE